MKQQETTFTISLIEHDDHSSSTIWKQVLVEYLLEHYLEFMLEQMEAEE